MMPPLGKEPVSLSKRVADYVLAYIGTRNLSLGDKVPSELKVSADLNVSRGIVREAYRSLSAAGIIEVSAGRAPKVGELSDSFLGNMIRQGICTRQFSTDQLLGLTGMIQVRAAELASQNRTIADLRRLRGAVAGMRRSTNSPNHFLARELSFYDAVSRAAGDPLLHLIGGALRACVKHELPVRQDRSRRAELVDRSIAAKVLVDAIQAGDLWLASRLMKIYVDDGRKALLTLSA